MTVNAIHKRVKNLCELEVIRKFTATPNLANLQGQQVLISGISNEKAVTEMCQELGKHESVFFIGITGGKHLLIDGELRKDDDIQEYCSFVTETAKLSNPFIGYINQPKVETPETFTKTDIAILSALSENGRKSTVDIAVEIGISTKTIRKSLKRMQDKKMVDFSIFWAPDSEKDIIGNFELYLSEEQNLNEETFQFHKEYPNIIFLQTFKNITNLIMLTTWFEASRKLQKAYEKFDTSNFKDVILRVIYTGYFFETWRMNIFDEF